MFSGIRAYEQLGNRAFGHPGKMLAAVIITVHNIGGNVVSFPSISFTSDAGHKTIYTGKYKYERKIRLFWFLFSYVKLSLHRKV